MNLAVDFMNKLNPDLIRILLKQILAIYKQWRIQVKEEDTCKLYLKS